MLRPGEALAALRELYSDSTGTTAGSGGSGEGARDYGRDAGSLGIALGAYGLLTYIYFAVASHTLGADAYGDLVVLWAAVFILVATLYRPVEQLLTRSIAHRSARGLDTGEEIRNAGLLQSLAVVLFVIAALAARGPIEDELLSGDSGLYLIFVIAVVGFAGSFFVRGMLAGSRRFGLYAVLIIAEAIARFSMALIVAIGIADGATAVAVGIALGPAVSLLVIAVPLLRDSTAAAAAEPATAHPAADQSSIAHGSGFAIAVLFIMGAEQILINGGPLFVRIDAGAAAAGFLFNVLMLVRAPLLAFQAVISSLLPHLTRLASVGDAPSLAAFSRSVRITLGAVAGFSVLVGLVVLAAGPTLMQLAFGDEFDYPRLELLAMCPLIGVYLASWTLNQAALARGQARAVALCWVAAAIVFAAVNLVPADDPVTRAEVAFGASTVILLALLSAVYLRGSGRASDVPVPGSAEELEARLAVADEAGI